MTAIRRVERFPFRMRRRWRLPLLPFGVTPGRAWVEVSEESIRARFGWWQVDQPLSNVERWAITGPYRWWRAIGMRWSWFNLDVTFGTDAHGGVRLDFRRPFRLLGFRHPQLYVTVDDLDGLAAALERRGIPGRDEVIDR
jgi:hypothetical protein